MEQAKENVEVTAPVVVEPSVINKIDANGDSDPDIDTNPDTDSVINKSFEKMDSLIMKLQAYTKMNNNKNIENTNNMDNTNNIENTVNTANTKNIQNTANTANTTNTKNKIIKNESPEYYANEQFKFLSDACIEKDKRMNIVNNILNVSIIANIVLISYILGTYFY